MSKGNKPKKAKINKKKKENIQAVKEVKNEEILVNEDSNEKIKNKKANKINSKNKATKNEGNSSNLKKQKSKQKDEEKNLDEAVTEDGIIDDEKELDNLQKKVDEAIEDITIKEEIDKEVQEKEVKKNIYDMIKINKKIKRTIVISLIVVILVLLLSTGFALINMNSNKIISNTYINGVNVSGKTKAEAKEILNNKYANKANKEVTLKYQDFETKMTPSSIEYNFKIDNAVDEAYSVARNNNILKDNYEILFHMFVKKNIQLEDEYNMEFLDQFIDGISSKLPEVVKQPSYNVDGEILFIYPGNDGVIINKNELKKAIIAAVKNQDEKSIVEIPATKESPEKINLDKIYSEVKKDPKDASYDEATGKLTLEENGVDFAITKEEASKLLLEKKDEYQIPLKVVKPKVTVKDLKNVAEKIFSDTISTYSTRYNGGLADRTTNLRIAANKINGYILGPGEVFSFNKVVGKRTVEAGYRNAPIFSGGKIVDDIGGGICQIATTLYNTALLGDFQIVERHKHGLPVSYEKPGRDATVYYGVLDFKFKNNRNYPVRINAGVHGGIVNITITGAKGADVRVNVGSEKVRVIPKKEIVEYDNNMYEGEEKVLKEGIDGSEVITFSERIVNGVSEGRTQLSRDVVSPIDRVIVKGTKKKVEKNPKPETKPEVREEKPKEENNASTNTDNKQGE